MMMECASATSSSGTNSSTCFASLSFSQPQVRSITRSPSLVSLSLIRSASFQPEATYNFPHRQAHMCPKGGTVGFLLPFRLYCLPENLPDSISVSTGTKSLASIRRVSSCSSRLPRTNTTLSLARPSWFLRTVSKHYHLDGVEIVLHRDKRHFVT